MTANVQQPLTIQDARIYVNQQLEAIRNTARDIAGTVKSHIIHSSRILTTLTSMMEDGMILLDKDNRITIFNPAASQLFGITEKEALGRQLDQVLPYSKHPIRVRSTDIRVEDDNFRLMIARRDNEADAITAQLRRELDVRDMAMWNYPLPTFYSDLEGNALRASREFCNRIGVELDAMRSLNVRDLIAEEYHHWYFRTDDRSTIRMIVRSRDTETAMTAQKSLVRDSVGIPVGFITCFTNEPAASEEAEFASSFVRAFDSIENPMLLVSFSEGRVLLANKAYCSAYSYERNAVVNGRVETLYTSTNSARRAFVKQLLREGSATGVFRAVDGHGAKRLRSVQGMAVNIKKGAPRIPKYCLLSEI